MPSLVLRPSSLDFGTIPVGESAELVITILNVGSDSLLIDNVSGADEPFGVVLVTVIPVFRIGPGDSVRVLVTFQPGASGEFADTLRVTGSVSPGLILLFGTGEGEDIVSEPNPDFNGNGSVDFGDFIQFVQHYRAKEGDPLYDSKFDLNGNKSVDFGDFIVFAQAYG